MRTWLRKLHVHPAQATVPRCVCRSRVAPDTIDEVDAPPIELRIRYKRLNSFFADYAKNIHRGYTFIATDSLLDVGTDFLFLLELPGRDAALVLRGKVEWVVTPAQSQQDVGMGIRFVPGSDDERRRIEAIVEELMVASLGRALYESLLQRSAERTRSDRGPPAASAQLR